MTHPSAQSIVSLYRRHAKEWANARNKKLIEKPWLDAFLDLVPQNGQVFDLGCGAGLPVARYVADQGRKVTGVDAAAEMIEHFRRNVPNAHAIVNDMRSLALGSTFDGVIAWDSFFHLTPDDQRAMFGVFSAHVSASGALLFNSGPKHGEAIGSFEGKALYHSSLDEAEYRSLLDAHGFSVAKFALEDKSCGGRTIWLATKSATTQQS